MSKIRSIKRTITIEDVQRMYDNLYDFHERRIVSSLTNYYNTNIIEVRRLLIEFKNLLEDVDEDNEDIVVQQIYRLLDTNVLEGLYVDSSIKRYDEADRAFIVFTANDFKRDNALMDSQLDTNGNPILSLIGGSAYINRRETLNAIAKQVVKTVNKDMTLNVIKNNRDGMSVDDAIKATVKTFKDPKTKTWRLTRDVRSNLTTFVGDRTNNMINQNDLYTGKIWVTRNDEKVRDAHAANQRQGKIPKDQRFQSGQMNPGDRSVDIKLWINCRCYMRGAK